MSKLLKFGLAVVLGPLLLMFQADAQVAKDMQLPEGLELSPELLEMLENMSAEEKQEIMSDLKSELGDQKTNDDVAQCFGADFEISEERRQVVDRLQVFVDRRLEVRNGVGKRAEAQNAYEFARDCSVAIEGATIDIREVEKYYSDRPAFRQAERWRDISIDASQLVCSDMSTAEFKEYLTNGMSRFIGRYSHKEGIYLRSYEDLCNKVWEKELFPNEDGGK